MEEEGEADVGSGGNTDPPSVAPSGPSSQHTQPQQEFTFTLNIIIELFEYFGHRLSWTHTTWREPMRDIIIGCCEAIVSSEHSEGNRLMAMGAWFLLPGVIVAMGKTKGGERVVDVLRDYCAAPFPALAVLQRCWYMYEQRCMIPGGERQPVADTATRLARQVNICADEGRLGTACKIVERIHGLLEGESSLPPLTTEGFCEKVKELYPPDDERDVLPPPSDDPPGILIHIEDLTKALKGIARQSGKGRSGWTYAAILDVLYHRTPGTNNSCESGLSAFVAFINAFAASQLTTDILTLFNMSRVVMIPTKGKYRPLSIMDAWTRLASRTIHRKVASKLGERLAPLQLGIGIKGGCEIAARMAQLAYDIDSTLEKESAHSCLISFDIANAFNTMPRRNVYNALLERAPELVRVFRSLYGGVGQLYSSAGALVGSSCTGLRQGDPLAGLFFDEAFQPTLEVINEAISCPTLKPRGRVQGGLIAYHDDISVHIMEGGAHAAASIVRNTLADAGLRIQPPKCRILTHPGRASHLSNPYTPTHGIEVVDTGVVMLGNPVGSVQYRADNLQESLRTMVASLPALSHVHPQVALSLIRFCYNARPTYLARVAEPFHIFQDLAKTFDEAMDSAVAKLARATVSAEIASLRSLPPHMSGLGISRLGGTRGTVGNLAARNNTYDFVVSHESLHHLVSGMDQWIGYSPQLNADEEQVADEVDGAMELSEDERAAYCLPQTMSKESAINRRTWGQLHARLTSEERDHNAAWLMSGAAPGTGDWLMWRGGRNGRFRFEPDEFIESLRLRLLLAPFSNIGPFSCMLCHDVLLRDVPLHLLDCNKLNGKRIQRHNRVRDALAALVRKIHPEGKVTVEAPIRGNSGGHVRADVLLDIGGVQVAWDVAIVNPSAPTYVRLQSHIAPDIAAKDREKIKRDQFSRFVQDPAGITLIPFVIEATGRLGPAASTYMRTIGEKFGFARREFVGRMSAAIARFNARMIMLQRNELLGYQNGFRGP